MKGLHFVFSFIQMCNWKLNFHFRMSAQKAPLSRTVDASEFFCARSVWCKEKNSLGFSIETHPIHPPGILMFFSLQGL